MIFLDPAPSVEPTGLQPGTCETCGGRALVDAAYAGTVRCSACWSAFHHAPVPGVTQHPRYAGGHNAPAPTQELGRSDVTAELRGSTPHSSMKSTPYRVLIPTRDATPSQIPAGAAAVRAAAEQAGRRVRVTYALAEELATGRMVHSCAVRVAGLGYAIWRDGSFSGAWPNVGAAHFAALVAGALYVPPAPRTPPPTGPCPRCGRSVRWKLKPTVEPYAHNREQGGENSRGQKISCA